MRRGVILLVLAVLLVQNANALGEQNDAGAGNPVELYFFWGDGCPHCAKMKPVLAELEGEYPGLDVKHFEVYYNESNLELLQQMIEAYGRHSNAVPVTFIADTMIEGYMGSYTDEKLEGIINECLLHECVSPEQKLQAHLNPTTTSAAPTTTSTTPATTVDPVAEATPQSPPLSADTPENRVVVHFFWGDGCPHCAHEKPFLEELQRKYPRLEVRMHETWKNPENAEYFKAMADAYGVRASGVPMTFIGDFEPTVGFASEDTTGKRIEDEILYCLENGCIDPASKLSAKQTVQDKPEINGGGVCVHVFVTGECASCQDISGFLERIKGDYDVNLVIHDVSQEGETDVYEKFKDIYGFEAGGYPTVFIGNVYLVGEKAIRENLEDRLDLCLTDGCMCPAEKIKALTPYPPQPGDITAEEESRINLPLFGEIDAGSMSLPVFTVVIAGLDSFNPCAFFVLFFLLSMLIHAKSRKRMLLIGATFIFFSGLMYFLFMAAWLNIFMLIGELRMITVAAGLVALIVAAINIKDFFYFGKGASLTIPDSAKPKLFKRMRELLKASSLYSMMIGTIVLAVSANAYELLCTAGFPMVFTRVLTLNDLSTTQYYLYLAFYNLVYVIPLTIIVLMFTITLGARKLTEWEGQVLKLMSGMMMMGLGLAFLFKPALLNNILFALGMLAAAIALTGLIAYLTKKRQKQTEKKEEVEDNEQP